MLEYMFGSVKIKRNKVNIILPFLGKQYRIMAKNIKSVVQDLILDLCAVIY